MPIAYMILELQSGVCSSLLHRSVWLLPPIAASEWKYFLLFYIPVTLYGILPDKLYIHALILTKAIRLLLSSRISEESLQLAQKLLKKFCKLNEEYYG